MTCSWSFDQPRQLAHHLFYLQSALDLFCGEVESDLGTNRAEVVAVVGSGAARREGGRGQMIAEQEASACQARR